MIKAIIYSSHQGFSKQYAYEYAIKTGIPIYSLEEAEKLVDKTKSYDAKEAIATLCKMPKTKMEDLNAASLETAMSMVEGTARSMGVVVTE